MTSNSRYVPEAKSVEFLANWMGEAKDKREVLKMTHISNFKRRDLEEN
jgi:hypothetical protein